MPAARSRWKMWVSSWVTTIASQSSLNRSPWLSIGGAAKMLMRFPGTGVALPFA